MLNNLEYFFFALFSSGWEVKPSKATTECWAKTKAASDDFGKKGTLEKEHWKNKLYSIDQRGQKVDM